MAKEAMEQSAPCTPEAGPLNTTRDSDNMIYDSRGVRTPASGGLNSSFVCEPQSPLGQLDPHRLRDMVVDKQNPGGHVPMESPYKQQQYWDHNSGCPASSPSNMRPGPNNSNPQMGQMMHPSRLPQGAMCDSSVMSPGGVRSSQQMGMCIPGRSPLNSPGGMHPSPFAARPANASPSPYMQPIQTPVPYPQGMQQMPQSPAPGILPAGQVPPASPGGVYPPRMGTMGPPQQQYSYNPQVQPQWNPPPQPHYVGQPQMMGPAGPPQRVMIHRVQYPNAGYSQGMAQPQSSSGQPPPSPVVYPPGVMQTNMQPQPTRPIYGGAPQQMSNPQQMPGAQYPANYYQPKAQPGYPPQSPMYRQPPSQAVPVRAYIANQPQQIASSPVYPSMYPAPGGTANVQPQQYSPVARYQTPVQNTAGISPCYPQAGHDMRSPQLISPTQAQIVPSGVAQVAPPTMVAPVGANAPQMQRSISTMDLQAGGGAIPSQHMHIVSSPFYGHEPTIAANVQQDMCLVGCFFIVLENERFLIDRLDVQEMSAVVRMHGGEIEIGPRVLGNISGDRITHVICESIVSLHVQTAIDERKRCVTLQWLNDVIAKKRLEPPWRVSHLPTVWSDGKRPAVHKIIAINGFEESERNGVRMMIHAIGARFTPYLTKHNDYLVTKSCEGERLQRCRELGVVIVNYKWLVDLYLGLKTSVQDTDINAYLPVSGLSHNVNISPYDMEHYTQDCKRLLEAWRRPVVFSNEQWQHALEVKRNVENDENLFPNKRLRLSTPPPSAELIEKQRSLNDRKEGMPVVCFSGFTQEEEDTLSRKIRYLGAAVTENVTDCTHLVVLNLWRTMELLEAVALGKNIIGPDWIIDGYRNGLIPDTLDYFVRDEENEKLFGYNLKYSILKARYRRVFQDVMFYLTPSVEPSYNELRTLIMLAGGTVLTERPRPYDVADCIQKEIPLVLISNDSDVHLLEYLTNCGLPVFNVELVLTGVLRQRVENSPFYKVTPIRQPSSSQMTPSPNPPSSVRSQPTAVQRVAS